MEHILIPEKRAELLKETKNEVEAVLKCKIEIVEGNEITIKGEAYDEYNAKNVIQAFGRGFEMAQAYKLLKDDYFFKFTNLKDFLGNEEQIRRIKARIIGTDGKTKLYIEEISGVDLSIYGNTIGMIGKVEEMNIASAALQVLIEGGTHKKAYSIMERMRRKLNEAG
jgi:ribosomal RNA assembly protein